MSTSPIAPSISASQGLVSLPLLLPEPIPGPIPCSAPKETAVEQSQRRWEDVIDELFENIVPYLRGPEKLNLLTTCSSIEALAPRILTNPEHRFVMHVRRGNRKEADEIVEKGLVDPLTLEIPPKLYHKYSNVYRKFNHSDPRMEHYDRLHLDGWWRDRGEMNLGWVKGMSIIHIAAYYGQDELLKDFVRKYHKLLDKVNSVGWTALHYAAPNTLRTLLDGGIDPVVGGTSHITPLAWAFSRREHCPPTKIQRYIAEATGLLPRHVSIIRSYIAGEYHDSCQYVAQTYLTTMVEYRERRTESINQALRSEMPSVSRSSRNLSRVFSVIICSYELPDFINASNDTLSIATEGHDVPYTSLSYAVTQYTECLNTSLAFSVSQDKDAYPGIIRALLDARADPNIAYVDYADSSRRYHSKNIVQWIKDIALGQINKELAHHESWLVDMLAGRRSCGWSIEKHQAEIRRYREMQSTMQLVLERAAL